jgi:SAM-dependent methyltransferase
MITVNYNNQILNLKWTNIDNLIKFINYQVFPCKLLLDEPVLKKIQISIFLKTYQNVMKSLIDTIIPLLENKEINKIVSVGSGVATFELLLSQYIKDANIYLVDKNDITAEFPLTKETIFSENHGFYNSQDVTKDAIITSNLDVDRFNFLNPDNNWPSKLDLVISKFAWCYNFPKHLYWNQLLSSLKLNGILILEIPHYNKNYVDEISNELGCPATVIGNAKGLSFSSLNKFLSFDSDGTSSKCYLWTRYK